MLGVWGTNKAKHDIHKQAVCAQVQLGICQRPCPLVNVGSRARAHTHTCTQILFAPTVGLLADRCPAWVLRVIQHSPVPVP